MKYIHKDIGLYEVIDELSDNFIIGTSLTDFRLGKFILLSPEQVVFQMAYPNATCEEIYNMALFVAPIPTLQMLKDSKIAQIDAYDKSENVNSFLINEFPMWLDRDTRASLFATIAAYKANNISTITLWTTGSNPISITLSVIQLEGLLISLEMYAKITYDTTAQNKANVQAQTSNTDVNQYDYKTQYPEKLNFTI